ncbi:hypothetical protein, partial [Brevundimonas sp.]|uniref:hypothetical protein n=1 Tax=Brevundimonas sp. TaxID=1871086 RepID=UPI00391DE4F7
VYQFRHAREPNAPIAIRRFAAKVTGCRRAVAMAAQGRSAGAQPGLVCPALRLPAGGCLWKIALRLAFALAFRHLGLVDLFA